MRKARAELAAQHSERERLKAGTTTEPGRYVSVFVWDVASKFEVEEQRVEARRRLCLCRFRAIGTLVAKHSCPLHDAHGTTKASPFFDAWHKLPPATIVDAASALSQLDSCLGGVAAAVLLLGNGLCMPFDGHGLCCCASPAFGLSFIKQQPLSKGLLPSSWVTWPLSSLQLHAFVSFSYKL